MDRCIDMAEKRDPSINAFTYRAFDEARQKAKEAEKTLMDGDAKGAFFGVPTAIKDFLPGVPGWPNTMGGVKAVSHLTDTVYSNYSKAMLDEGAIIIGKTNAPSFAFRGTCDNKMFGATSTPFKPGYNSGGSSGGSAAAVGDGIVLIAEGTDAGGSSRIPVAWCGCYGYKAGHGVLPSTPRPDAFMPIHVQPVDGSISRTVKDTAYIHQAMAKFDPFDPLSVDLSGQDFCAALEKSVKDWKIAYTPDFGMFPVDAEVEQIVEKAALRFEDAGAHVEKVDFKFAHSAFEYAEAWCRLISISGMQSFEQLKAQGINLLKDHLDDLPDELVDWTRKLYQLDYVDYYYDSIMRTEIYDGLQTVLSDYDLIVSPTTICMPVKNDPGHDTVGPTKMNGMAVEPLIGWCETFLCNFSYNPAASVPAGISKDGFPVGMQIIGRRFHDEDVFAASAAFERISPWASIYDITAGRNLA